MKLVVSSSGRGDQHAEAAAERCKLLSTTPEYCRIAAFGFACGVDEPQAMVVGEGGYCEVDVLTAFWQLAMDSKNPLIGFNCLGFDLPVIYVRSMLLGVQPTRQLDMKPWGKDVIDLYMCRFGGRGNTSKDRPGKLKDLARVLDIEVPAGDTDGGDVARLMRDDPVKVAEYVKSDIAVTRALHWMYRGFFCS
jgi:predicted PolB exonuclease-like 3'-5' exonuclease